MQFVKKIRRLEFTQQKMLAKMDLIVDATQAEIQTVDKESDENEIMVIPIS